MEQMQEKVEKSQGEIYRLRAKLENTQAENENIQEEFDKLQQALSRSYAERDKYASSEDKLREELERVQVSGGVQWWPGRSLNSMIKHRKISLSERGRDRFMTIFLNQKICS